MPKSATLPVLPGIKIVSKTLADGTVKTFHYHRATKLALGSDRARAIARAAEIETLAGPELRTRHVGTIADIVAKYKASPEYLGLAEKTKALWRPFLRDLEDRVGDWVPKLFTRAMGSKFKATLISKHGSGSARNRFKCYARLWNWAIQNGYTEISNPFVQPGSFLRGRKNQKAKPIWRNKDVEAFLFATRQIDVGGNPAFVAKKVTRTEGVPDDMRLAFLLALFTLQRRGDILKITGDKIRADNQGRWWLKLKQEKTGADVEFPVHNLLRAEIERQNILPGEKRPLVQTKSEGMFDDRNFSRKFRTWLEAAKIRGLNFHALRRSGMVWLAEAGVSAPRIAGLSGHSIAVTQKILDEYIVRTKELAEAAIDAFERITQDAFPVHVTRS
jgi:integrase